MSGHSRKRYFLILVVRLATNHGDWELGDCWGSSVWPEEGCGDSVRPEEVGGGMLGQAGREDMNWASRWERL